MNHSPQESKNHHFVPQAYLRRWCADGTKLRRMFKRHGKLHCVWAPPSRVGSRKYLYKIDEENCGITTHLLLMVLAQKHGQPGITFNFEDTLMQELDQRGAKALQRILEDETATQDMQCLFDLFRYLHLLRARNPHFLESINEPAVEELRELAAKFGASDNTFLDLEGLKHDCNAAKLHVIDAVLDREEIIRKFDNMACIPCDIDPNVNRYVTGDHAYTESPTPWGTLHMIPLSPTRCHVMSRSLELIERLKKFLNHNFVDLVNSLIIMLSSEVYAWDDATRDSVAQHLGLMWRDAATANAILGEKLKASLGAP